MSNGTIVLFGDLAPRGLDHVALEFGWSVENVDSFGGLLDVSGNRKLVAVLFERYTFDLSWNRALKSVIDAAPAALPIACYRFSDEIDWPELAAAGAFHALPLPLDEGELRQSLGYAWAAKSQRPRRLPLRHQEPTHGFRLFGNARAAGVLA